MFYVVFCRPSRRLAGSQVDLPFSWNWELHKGRAQSHVWSGGSVFWMENEVVL